MSATIRSVFEDATRDVKIDTKLMDRVHRFERAFVNRNPEHVAFFGGNLMGVHTMRFRPTDRDDWFNDILQIDDLLLEDGLKNVPSINSEWVRANDVMNHSCVWLLHVIYKSNLPPKIKEQAMIDAMLILQYKFLGSLMGHYFRYPADEATMLATYNQLSRKYALKQAGSWSALLIKRAEDIISPKSIHFRTFTEFSNDKDIIYMISDIQGRLREIIKSMWAVFDVVRKEGGKIQSSSATIELNGETILRDKTKKYATFIRYSLDVSHQRESFVKDELIEIITDAMHTVSPRLLKTTLEWMAVNRDQKTADKIEELIRETLIFAFDIVAKDRALYSGRSGLGSLLTKLRALYMASRMSDVVLLRNKSIADDIVRQAINSKNASVQASVRTSVQMYIVLRALAKSHYTE